VWDVAPDARQAIREALEEKFAFLFEQLDAVDTVALVEDYIEAP
jgi:hypothetical protein